MDALFKTLVENSSEAIVLLNADGSVRFASESSVRLLGYTLEERLGRSAFEMLHPDDVPQVVLVLQVLCGASHKRSPESNQRKCCSACQRMRKIIAGTQRGWKSPR